MHFGLLIDAYYDSIHIVWARYGGNTIKDRLHCAQRIGFDNIREATLIISFGSAISNLFNNYNKETLGFNKAVFNQFPTYKDFEEKNKLF